MSADAVADSGRSTGGAKSSQLLLLLAGALAFAGLAAAPVFASPYTLTLLGTFIAYAIALLGFNLLFGYTGLLSFGHAMFVAIGAYTAAVFSSKLGQTSFGANPCGGYCNLGRHRPADWIFCVRYTKIFFSMLTLAFGMTFHSFLFKFYNVTGGDQGMRVGRPLLLNLDFPGGKTAFLIGPFYYYSLALLALAALLAWRIVKSPFGLHLQAIRENAQKAAYLGVEVYRLRLQAFVISAVYCAVAGVLLGVSIGLADPELGYWTQSGNLVFMTVLGGSSSFAGPLLGAFVFVFLQDALMASIEYWRFILGGTLIAVIVFFPNGLAGLVQHRSRQPE